MTLTKCYAYENQFDLNRFRDDCSSGINGIWAVQTPEPELTLRGVVHPTWQRFLFNYHSPTAMIVGYDLFDKSVEDTIEQVRQTFEKYSVGDVVLMGVLA